MFYYNVWVRSDKFKSKNSLTYGSDTKLEIGTIVVVPLKDESVLGFVYSPSEKPRFKIKSISKALEDLVLPKKYLKLAYWISEYYFSSVGDVTRLLFPRSLEFEPNKITKNNNNKLSLLQKTLPPLTKDQVAVINKIDSPGTYLLHGRTGSGKTRVYLDLSLSYFKKGYSSIILTPEISLTSQLYKNFKKIFKDRVILVHSKLSIKQRQEFWIKCLTSLDPIVIIGPRSALFYPLNKIGLIIIDEAHETSYKSDQTPKYQGLRVASMLSKFSNASLLMGSATPSIADYHIASERNVPILKMTKLAKNNSKLKNSYEIVDLKDRTNFTKSRLLSNQLIESINEALNKKQQVLIYLNRRGTSRLILCDQCGWESLCPKCNLPMTYHQDKDILICHSCGLINKSIPKECPICHNVSIIFKTAGTKAIESELLIIFPTKKIARFDSDNIKSERIDQNLENLLNGNIEILIGTQLLAKGFDLPNLSVVGLVQADTSLYIPDFTSKERTFQLITQVLGRINRGHLDGKAIIQTYNPKSTIINNALDQNYEAFYNEELKERKLYKFPPYYYLLKLTIKKKSPELSEKTCIKIIELIKNSNIKVIIEGPAPSFHEKINNLYNWQIVLKATDRKEFLKTLKLIPGSVQFDLDPNNLL